MATKQVGSRTITLTAAEEQAIRDQQATDTAAIQARENARVANLPTTVSDLLTEAQGGDVASLAVTALALVLLDRINALEADHGRQGFTKAQLAGAIQAKVNQILT